MTKQKFRAHLSDHKLEQAVEIFNTIERVENLYRIMISTKTDNHVQELISLVEDYNIKLSALEYVTEKGMEYEIMHKRYATPLAEIRDMVREAGFTKQNFELARKWVKVQELKAGVFK